MAQTLAKVFPTVESLRIQGERNFLVMAHRGKPLRLWREIRKANPPEGFSPKIWAAAGRNLSYIQWKPGKDSVLLRDYDSPLLLLHERMYERLR